MTEVQIQEMMDSGAHFGHQTKRWNPKMKPYIYGARSGVHIIDLQKTKELAANAFQFLVDIVASGKSVLFVGTKPQAREVIKEEAARSKMHYVNDRWMGGTLTNFQTIKKSIDRLIEYETRRVNNDFTGYTKKELLDIDRQIIKWEASLGGIKTLSGMPGAVFIVDPHLEKIAVTEAQILNVPIVAITDTNCDPDPIEFVIPGNDDAISSVQYFVRKIADACLEGLEKRETTAQRGEEKPFPQTATAAPARRPAANTKGRRPGGAGGAGKPEEKKGAYVSRAESFEGDAAGGFSASSTSANPATPVVPVSPEEKE